MACRTSGTASTTKDTKYESTFVLNVDKSEKATITYYSLWGKQIGDPYPPEAKMGIEASRYDVIKSDELHNTNYLIISQTIYSNADCSEMIITINPDDRDNQCASMSDWSIYTRNLYQSDRAETKYIRIYKDHERSIFNAFERPTCTDDNIVGSWYIENMTAHRAKCDYTKIVKQQPDSGH